MNLNDILGAIVALVIILVTYAIYFAAIFAFLWAVRNWIVLPTLPYVVGLFA